MLLTCYLWFGKKGGISLRRCFVSICILAILCNNARLFSYSVMYIARQKSVNKFLSFFLFLSQHMFSNRGLEILYVSLPSGLWNEVHCMFRCPAGCGMRSPVIINSYRY